MKESPPCEQCTGLCCTAKATWFRVPLTTEEQGRPLFQGFAVAAPGGPTDYGILFDEKDGCCPFLDRATRRCTIYHERPAACRIFDCRKLTWVSPFFHANPEMLRRIADHEKTA